MTIDSYVLLYFKPDFCISIKETRNAHFRKKKKITILLSPEYFSFQFIINKYKIIWIILRLEVMRFSNLEGEEISSFCALFKPQFVIKCCFCLVKIGSSC